MSGLLLPIPRFHGRGLSPEWSNHILVGADGRESSDAAIAMAWALAKRAVLDLVSVLGTNACGMAPEEERSERMSVVGAQLKRVIGTLPDGEMLVQAGSPADIIADAARRRLASLLVIGLGTCPVRDRLLGEELALAIARRARTPLLAVAPGHTKPPKRIVVGMDFSPASYSACEAVLEIGDSDALVVLANVIEATSRKTPSGVLWRLVEETCRRDFQDA